MFALTCLLLQNQNPPRGVLVLKVYIGTSERVSYIIYVNKTLTHTGVSMTKYKSPAKWVNHTESEKRVISFSFPNYIFLTEEEHARRVGVEESIFNMIIEKTSTMPEQVGLFSANDFIVFWENESSNANVEQSFFENLGLKVSNILTVMDHGNAMAGIATWQHNVYLTFSS